MLVVKFTLSKLKDILLFSHCQYSEYYSSSEYWFLFFLRFFDFVKNSEKFNLQDAQCESRKM